MRPVRHRRFSEDSDASLKKCGRLPGLASEVVQQEKEPPVKIGKKRRILHKQTDKLKSAVGKESTEISKLKNRNEDKYAISRRKNELSILIDANIEHYSGRRRRGSIDVKAPRIPKTSVSDSPKKEVDSSVAAKRELRNGKEANYLVDVSDDESPPPKKKFRRETVSNTAVADSKVNKQKQTKVLKVKVTSRTAIVDVKKDIVSDESLDAPIPPRKKPRKFREVKSKSTKKELKPILAVLSSETGYQSEFVKSVLTGQSPLIPVLKGRKPGRKKKNLIEKERETNEKQRETKEKVQNDNQSVQKLQSVIPTPVPGPVFLPFPSHEASAKCNPFAPYPLIEQTGVGELTKYSFEGLPLSDVWFYTYLRQDMNLEQNRYFNVHPVRGGEGFTFELPYEMPVSRIISKPSGKTPVKKVQGSDSCKKKVPYLPRRLGRHLSQPGIVCEESEASDSSHTLSICNVSENLTNEQECVTGILTSEQESVPSPHTTGTETPTSNHECQDIGDKKRKYLRKIKPCLDDFARKSPRCHASTLAMLSELRHKLTSDGEDSQSESGDSKCGRIREPVKIMCASEVETYILEPLGVGNFRLEAEQPVLNHFDFDFPSLNFDDIFDLRELDQISVSLQSLPDFPPKAEAKLVEATMEDASVVASRVQGQESESCESVSSRSDLMVKVETQSQCKTEGSYVSPVKKRDKPRRRPNATGWPKNKRKTPSRASTASTESQDSRAFMTPLPVETFESESFGVARTKAELSEDLASGLDHEWVTAKHADTFSPKRLKRTAAVGKSK